MNKVTMRGNHYNLNGDVIKLNSLLEFKAKDKNNKDWFIKDIKGIKVISLFPDINTHICDGQTKQIAQMAEQYKDITFISVSTDLPEVQQKWCAANGLKNVLIVSDQEYKDFADKTKTYIAERDQLIRGFILLDDDNVIKGISISDQVSTEPDYELLNKWIK